MWAGISLRGMNDVVPMRHLTDRLRPRMSGTYHC